MGNDPKYVEKNADIILTQIRNTPGITFRELQTKLSETGTFPHLKKTMVLRYLTTLHKEGYIQKTGIHIHTYKSLTDTSFKYVPVALKKPGKKLEKVHDIP